MARRGQRPATRASGRIDPAEEGRPRLVPPKVGWRKWIGPFNCSMALEEKQFLDLMREELGWSRRHLIRVGCALVADLKGYREEMPDQLREVMEEEIRRAG